MANKKTNKEMIGLIEGGGTGPEIAEIFKKVVATIYKKEKSKQVEFFSFKDKYGYFPHTFLSLQKKFHNASYFALRKTIDKEYKDLKKFYLEAREKTLGVFRTAVNAETLYYLRRDTKKLKVVPLLIKLPHRNVRILFIRDQLQGYYTNKKIKCKKRKIDIYSIFSEENFKILTNATKEMVKRFGFKKYDLLFLYKFHLFGLEIERMIKRAIEESKLEITGKINICQPDTGIHKLLGELPHSKSNKDIVIIAGNEIGDVLLETLIHFYKLGTKETFYTLNVAFINETNKLEVLQTMHGSADDIAGMELLNPIATIRAAAYALERWLKIPRAIERMEKAIEKAIENKMVTKDMGGDKKTTEVVNYLLSVWK